MVSRKRAAPTGPSSKENSTEAVAPMKAAVKTAAESPLDRARRRIEAGDGRALLVEVAHYIGTGEPLPEWLANEFVRRVNGATIARKVRSWDEAFGPLYPTSYPFAARQRLPRERLHVRKAIVQALQEDPRRPIDAGFWEEVAACATRAGCPMAKSKADEIYRGIRRSESIQDVRNMLAVLSVASYMRAANRSRPVDEVFFAEVSERAGVPLEECRYHLLTPDGECWDFDPDIDLDPAKFAPAFSPKKSGVSPKR